MSFGDDVGKKKTPAHMRSGVKESVGRQLNTVAVGERVLFTALPTVRGDDGRWRPAPSLEAEVVFYVGGSPFVRFILPQGKTRPCWVGSNHTVE